ncbi:MAG: SDR family oxidoreductase [Chloroflexi bacterium]|nr:SDR family oxidoreductase [Chloroflexota bacterium]
MEAVKSCLISGASRGIGAATAQEMARRGYHVFVNYRSSHSDASRLIDQIRQSGGSAESIPADVTDREAVGTMFQQVSGAYEQLDVLIHNAAIPLVPKRFSSLDWIADVLPQMEVNARGFLNLVQAANPLLSSGSRVVVLLTDSLFHTPPVQMGGYLAAKGALWGLVRAVAKELRPKGVSVNTVSPSMVDTDLLSGYPGRALEIFAQDHPMGRLATPEDVAAVVASVAAEAGGYLHGANIVVNGGSET